MTKGEAKRHACLFAVDILAGQMSGYGENYAPMDEWSEVDHGRFDDALNELIDELGRRGRRQKKP